MKSQNKKLNKNHQKTKKVFFVIINVGGLHMLKLIDAEEKYLEEYKEAYELSLE